jgi:IS30 family transposase
MAKNKHLTDLDRLQIQHGLLHRNSIKKIAFDLGKSSTTISREIRKRAVSSNKCHPYKNPNRCIHRFDCSIHYLCEDKPNCIKQCRSCKLCNKLCSDFVEDICKKLSFPPYVCNGCPDEYICVLRKKYYLHNPAHQNYRKILVETREGVNISEDELVQLDEFVSPLIMKGQSIHHIVANNKDEFSVSEKSLYRYVSEGLLKARNIDMPRVCRLKPRVSKPLEHKVDSACRIGRTYDDYKNYLSQHNDIFAVEMDSVIGRIGGKVLLTLMFKSCDLMLAFIRDRNTSQSVIDIFNWLYTILERDLFCTLFPALLGDNGSEFSNPTAIEFDNEGNLRTKVFYCDPRASFQKPNVELNHEFIRKVLPK